MHSRARALAALAISLTILGLVVYAGFLQFMTIRAEIAADAAREHEIALNKDRLGRALSTLGVEPALVTQGFWYVRTDAAGDDSIGFFDPEVWARIGHLSDDDIAALMRGVASTTQYSKTTMHAVAEEDLPPELQFHNKIYSFSSKPGEYDALQSDLEATYARDTASSDQLWQLAYLYELAGQYAKRDEVNARNCARFKVRCPASIAIRITGIATDLSGRPIRGAAVSAISHPKDAPVMTDEHGAFSLPVTADAMEKIRISIVKRNFSEGFADVIVVGAGKHSYDVGTITLAAPITIVTLDTQKHTITDPADSAASDGSFVIKGPHSAYTMPAHALVHADGTPYEGPADVYVYEFDKDTVPQNLISLDTFDAVMGYAGNAMESYGMPYIQFFSPKGEELHVLKSNPLIVTYSMVSFESLKTLPKEKGGPLSDKSIAFLVSVSSHASGFPLTRDFLVTNGLYTFPPFWVLDRKKGVWDNVGMRLLDTEGTIQAPFYTLNDQ